MDAFVPGISTKIRHRLVELESATDILRFSFVAQSSISPLDLSQPEGLEFFPYSLSRGFQTCSILDSGIQYPKYIINTEEKCRKILSTTRDVLYRLHLDLPKKREPSLKDGPEPEEVVKCSSHRHIGKMTVHSNFHFALLSSLVRESVKRCDNKLKMIKWLVTFDAVTESVTLNNQHVHYFAKYMYSEVTGSAFVKAFLKKLNLDRWIVEDQKSEILEFFLYHLRQIGGALKDNTISNYEPIDISIINKCFLHIATILKYQDAPRVPSRATVWDIYTCLFQSEFPRRKVLRKAEKRTSPKRFYLLMQLLYVFFKSPTKPAAECLRLLWNSLPDAFFSFEEIEMAFQGKSSETIRDLYNFYSGAVGVFHERVEPRSLKHLSRPIVRRMLWDSGCWIPDGIKLIGVPKELQSFLNLEA